MFWSYEMLILLLSSNFIRKIKNEDNYYPMFLEELSCVFRRFVQEPGGAVSQATLSDTLLTDSHVITIRRMYVPQCICFPSQASLISDRYSSRPEPDWHSYSILTAFCHSYIKFFRVAFHWRVFCVLAMSLLQVLSKTVSIYQVCFTIWPNFKVRQ